jgi:hypothetical protein
MRDRRMKKLEEKIRLVTNRYRSVMNTLSSETVQSLYARLNEKHKEQFDTLALKGENTKLVEFINAHMTVYQILEHLTVKELRKIAVTLSIKDYMIYPKIMLLSKIKERTIRNEKD